MSRRTRLRYVECWPSLVPSRNTAGGAPARVRKSSAAVTELYSRHLAAGEPLLAGTWWVRLHEPLEGLPPGFPCEPKPNAPGGFGLAAAILDLPDMQRRLALLDVVQFQLMRMAADEGWPTEPLIAAYDACVADGLELRLVSAPKASPDRRLKAHVAYTIDCDGDGRTTLHVQDREGATVYQSEPWVSPCEAREFTGIARSVRWIDRTTVSVAPWPVLLPHQRYVHDQPGGRSEPIMLRA